MRSVKEYSCVENYPMRAHRKRLRLLTIAKCCAVLCESSESLWRAFQFPLRAARRGIPRCTGAFSTADTVRLAAGNRSYAPRCSAASLVLAGGAELRSGLCACAVVCIENMRRASASAVCGTRDGTIFRLPSGRADVRGYVERLCFSRPAASEQKKRIGRRNRSALPYISRWDGAFASHCRADAFAARKLRL